MRFDLAQVIPYPLENFIALPIGNLSLHFGKREMDDVVMMNFFSGQIVADVDPKFMQEINFFGR